MQTETHDSPQRRTYLLVMPAGLVVQDMTETLMEVDPACQVISTENATTAIGLLSGEPALIVAFVRSDPDAFETSDLRRAIERCGGRAVLIGTAAERIGRGSGWVVLRQPFFPDNIRTLLTEFAVQD